MTESDAAKPEIAKNVPTSHPHGETFPAIERSALLQVIPQLFGSKADIEGLLGQIGYPLDMRPNMPPNSGADEFWVQIFRDLDNGIISAPAPYEQLLRAAAHYYPANETLYSMTQRLGLIEPEASASPGLLPAEQASTDAYHVIVGAMNDEERNRARQFLEKLGLGPREVWSTAHAVSYSIDPEYTDDPRLALERSDTNLGWTVVPPGAPDYVYGRLYVEGPDGRQFRLTDTPAQETVGSAAADVVAEYPAGMISSTRPTMVDRVGPSGQGERLNPEETLHAAGVRDGDRLRVGFRPTAGGGSASAIQGRSSVDELQITLHELMVEQQRVRLERERVRLERERIRLRQEELKLKQEGFILQEVSRRVSNSTSPTHSSHAGMTLAEDTPSADSMQLAIYADVEEDTEEWRRLSSAGEAVAEALGFARESQLPTEYGSVFQRAFWKRIATSDEARQYEAMLQQALGLKVAMLKQAEVDSKQATAAADLIVAVAAVPTACVKVGSLLLVKYATAPNDDPVVLLRSLSLREVQAIDRYPAILKNPHTALDALNMAIAAAEPPEVTSDKLDPE